jgi:signal transduction histidine kinase
VNAVRTSFRRWRRRISQRLAPRSGDAALFTAIRWRLASWHVAVFGVILLLVGGATYIIATRWLAVELDRDLVAQATRPHQFEQGTIAPANRGYRGGQFFVLLNADGSVRENPQQVALPPLALPAGPLAPDFQTVTITGAAVRLYIRPLPAFLDSHHLSAPAVVVVGQSLVPLQAAQRRLLTGFVAGGAIGLLLILFGSWFLAGRALVPIATAFRRQQEFVADASHELRTPLTVLRASADLLARHLAEPLAANAEVLDDLRQGLSALEHLTSDLLALARAELDEMPFASAPFDLALFADEVARTTTPLARERAIVLRCDPGRESITVEADPDRLRQALLVLLNNAFQHTPPGGTVTVTTTATDAEALLTVRDTGRGISPEHLPRIFDRFYRVDAARSCPGGAGLGLAIAKEIVERHGGRLSIASTVGAGTAASIALPWIAMAPSAPEWLGRPSTFAPHQSGQG